MHWAHQPVDKCGSNGHNCPFYLRQAFISKSLHLILHICNQLSTTQRMYCPREVCLCCCLDENTGEWGRCPSICERMKEETHNVQILQLGATSFESWIFSYVEATLLHPKPRCMLQVVYIWKTTTELWLCDFVFYSLSLLHLGLIERWLNMWPYWRSLDLVKF